MKIQALARIRAVTIGAADKKLTPKQKKLDINKNGKIDAEDLKKVRDGKLADKG